MPTCREIKQWHRGRRLSRDLCSLQLFALDQLQLWLENWSWLVIVRDITEIYMSRRYLLRYGLLVLLKRLVEDHGVGCPIPDRRALVVSQDLIGQDLMIAHLPHSDHQHLPISHLLILLIRVLVVQARDMLYICRHYILIIQPTSSSLGDTL